MRRRAARQWRVSPVRHADPRCESYENEAAVRRFEREVRIHRAHVEPVGISTSSDRIDGAYRVDGASGRAHLVDIVDASAVRHTCTCPDFLNNELGTCKHLEAVRRLVRALRTPLLPYDELASWSSGLRAGTVAQGSDQLAAVLAEDRRLLRERLQAIVQRPEVREALFIASPSLDESLASWIEQPTSNRGQKVEGSLVRYFIRMTSRPTPFGLFAGCSVGAVGERTRLTIDARDTYRRLPRLDGRIGNVIQRKAAAKEQKTRRAKRQAQQRAAQGQQLMMIVNPATKR